MNLNDPLIRVVDNARDFVSTPLGDRYQAVILPRKLALAFLPLAEDLCNRYNMQTRSHFVGLKDCMFAYTNPQLATCRDQVMADLKTFTSAPSADNGYASRLRIGQVRGFYLASSDVYGFHHDSNATDKPDTSSRVLCTYTGPQTEFLSVSDAVPTGGYTYIPRDGAPVHTLPHGWLLRFIHSGHKVPAFIHRAQRTAENGPYRLLLVGELPTAGHVSRKRFWFF